MNALQEPDTNTGKLPPIKIVYLLSLAALGLLLILTVLKPLSTGKEYSTLQKEQFTKTDEGWMIKFQLVNGEKETQSFIIEEQLDTGEYYQEAVTIPGGGVFAYSHHIYSEDVGEGEVNYQIYRNSEAEPFEKLTCHLK